MPRRATCRDEEVYAGVEKALRKYFGKRGERVVQDNLDLRQARLQRDAGDPAELINVDLTASGSRMQACAAKRDLLCHHAAYPIVQKYRCGHCQLSAPMNEASERDPFNNNCYGTLVDAPYKDGQAADARRARLQRPHHPRLRRGRRREGRCPPTCPWPAR